jgi:two-component sensor histidine kinase
MRKIILLFAAIVLSWSSYSQQNQIDSLQKLLHSSKSDTNRVKIVLNLSRLYSVNGNISSGLYYSEWGKKLSDSLHYVWGVATAYSMFGVAYNMSGNWDSAIIFQTKEMTLRRKIKNIQKLADALVRLSISYSNKGDYFNACNYLFEATQLDEGSNNTIQLGEDYSNIAALFIDLKLYRLGIEYIKRSLAISQKNNDEIKEAYDYNNLGSIYLNLKKYDSSLEYINKSVQIFKKNNLASELVSCYESLASLYTETGKYDSALSYINAYKNLSVYQNNLIAECLSNGQLGYVYMHKKDFVKAERYFVASVKIANETNTLDLQLPGYQYLTQIFINENKTRQADSSFKKFLSLNDSFINNSNIISSALAKFIEEKMNFQKTSLTRQRENERKIKNYFILGTIASVIVAIFILYLLINKRKQNKALAKERAAVSNLAGIMKHETARQFSNLSISLQKILSVKDPKLQVSKAIVEVKSNALLYSSLFISGGKALISFKKTAEELFTYNYSRNLIDKDVEFEVTGDVNLNVHGEEYLFEYLNELISNSLEHAFKDTDKPVIKISIEQTKDNTIIKYQDNGCGITNFDELITPGKGMYYIKLLAEDNMNAELETDFRRGSKFILTLHNTTP